MLLIPNVTYADDSVKVVDELDYLSLEDEQRIISYASELTSLHNINYVFYITDEYTDNISLQAAEKLESFGYYDGFIFEINYGIREYEVVCMGSAEYLRGYLQEALDVVYDGIANEDYVKANKDLVNFIDFAYYDYDHQANYNEGNYNYDVPVRRQEMSVGTKILIAAGASLLISIITIVILKKQLKSEGTKYNANEYRKPNSFRLTRSGDIFLFREVHRHLRPRDNNRSSGGSHGHGSFSSGHTSSGHSYSGGGGRKF